MMLEVAAARKKILQNDGDVMRPQDAFMLCRDQPVLPIRTIAELIRTKLIDAIFFKGEWAKRTGAPGDGEGISFVQLDGHWIGDGFLTAVDFDFDFSHDAEAEANDPVEWEKMREIREEYWGYR